MAALPSCLPIWEPPGSADPDETSTRNIEDYRPGYPRFAALISAHDPYFLCRRFDKLRARLLLQKQDKLSILEKRLEQVDHDETSVVFLGKSRCDKNAERISLLSEIDSTLADYGNTDAHETLRPLTKTRPVHRENEQDFRVQPCSAKRRREPAELGRKHRLSGPRGNCVPRAPS
ncbi:unnamed protein product [Penicillium glandicola]